METYKGKINEFVDWVSGEEKSFEEGITVSSTEGLPVSGASIRELLQTRLQHPITIISDEDAGLYRMFASDASMKKWQSMKDNGATEEQLRQFEIFNFERPTDWQFTVSGISNDTKYVVLGDREQSGCNFNLGFTISKQNGDRTSQPITVSIETTYKGNKYIHQPIEIPSSIVNSGNTYNLNIYDYLKSGVNGVKIIFKPKGISVTADYDFDVNVVQFQLEDVWSNEKSINYNEGFSPGEKITIPIKILRNITGFQMKVHAYVDGVLAKDGNNQNANAEFTVEDSGQIINKDIYIYNSYDASDVGQKKVHTLQIYATMNTGTYIFTSNLLYYTFETLSSVQGLDNRIINFQYSITDNRSLNAPIRDQEFYIALTQYQKFYLNWGYYNDNTSRNQQKDIDWYIKAVNESNEEETIVQQLGRTTGINRQVKDKFGFTPIVSENEGFNYFITGCIGEEQVLNILLSMMQINQCLWVRHVLMIKKIWILRQKS